LREHSRPRSFTSPLRGVRDEPADVYKQKSRVAKIIRAVRRFGEQNDVRLRQYAAKNAQEKLDRILRIIEE